MYKARIPRIITGYFIAALCIIVSTTTSARAQSWLTMVGPATRMLSSMPIIGSLLNADFPGTANPRMRHVYPPTFHGELRARALYLYSKKQMFSNPELGFSIDLHRDLGFDEEGALIELMARAQAGRYSLRAHYDEWLETFKSGSGNLSWPNYRMGVDLDLYHSPTFRIGANCDINWEGPVLNATPPGRTPAHIKWERPITAGAHASYNPFGYGSLALSCDARARWPISENSRITEFEIAGGLKGATTVTGASAIRGGWRYTSVNLRYNSYQFDMEWSGIFAEYVYTY